MQGKGNAVAVMKRKMSRILAEWYEAGHAKAFLLVGARQTGKTFVVRRFADECCESFVEVNLLEQPEIAAILASASDVDDFVARLSLASGQSVITGKTLIFLDEIQEVPELLTIVKFIVESGRFPLVLSGSMLGTELKGFRSFPVGFVQIKRMFPLDFEEFCWAVGVAQGVIDDVREAYATHKGLDQPLHERLMSMFRYFIAVGGMPEVVSTYLDASYDMAAVRAVAQGIVEQYRFDIAKYHEKRAPQIRAVYDAVPSQLDKENKRFRMDALKKGAAFDRFAGDFSWLIDAAVVLPTYQVAEPKRPLECTLQHSRFKLYESDTGLLLAQYEPQTTLDVLTNAAAVNFGGVYENAVAQALSCENPHLFYYHNNRKGEVDFIVTLNDGSLLPLEVKSGKDYKLHTALNNLLRTEEYKIEKACVLADGNVERGERMGKPLWYLPLYMVFCIAEQADGQLRNAHFAPPSF